MQIERRLKHHVAEEPAAGSPATRPSDDATLACAQTFMDLVPGLMDAVRQYMRAAAPAGVSVPQMRLLIFASRHGGASLSDVAEHLGVTLPTVSVAAHRLLESGLLENRADPRDRRRSAIWLTPAGEWAVQSARQRTRVDLAARLHGADAGTLETIQSGLLALARTLQTPAEPANPSASGRAQPARDALTVSPRAKTASPASRPVALPHP